MPTIGRYSGVDVILEMIPQIMPQTAKALRSATVVYQLREHSGPPCEAAPLSCGLEFGECPPGFLGRLFPRNGRCGHVDGYADRRVFRGSTVDRQRHTGDLSAYEPREVLPHV